MGYLYLFTQLSAHRLTCCIQDCLHGNNCRSTMLHEQQHHTAASEWAGPVSQSVVLVGAALWRLRQFTVLFERHQSTNFLQQRAQSVRVLPVTQHRHLARVYLHTHTHTETLSDFRIFSAVYLVFIRPAYIYKKCRIKMTCLRVGSFCTTLSHLTFCPSPLGDYRLH